MTLRPATSSRRQAQRYADGRHAVRQGKSDRVSAGEYPRPAISFAIEPKSRADEDKISEALHRILEEDPSLHFDRDAQTKEFILSGSGQLHIETVVGKLKDRFHVEVRCTRQRCRTRRRSPRRPRCRAVTRSSRADAGSSAIARSSWNRSLAAPVSNGSTRSLAAPSRRISARRSRRASSRRLRRIGRRLSARGL